MRKISIFIVLAGTCLSSAAYAQTSTSASGATSGSNAGAVASPVVTATNSGSSQSSSQSGSQSGATSGSQSGATSSNAGNAQSITNNSYAPDRQTIVANPAVFAPALTTTLTETCMGSSSLGVSVLGFGAAGGSTWQDHECIRRLNARELAQTLNDREAAREVLCGNSDVFRVYNALGRPCRLKPDGSPNPEWRPLPEPVPVSQAMPVAVAPQSQFMVFFGFASAAITPDAARILDGAAASYQQSGKAAIVVAGHTDLAGSAQYNETLSKQRAEAVEAYLIAKGVPANMQTIVAMGKSAPRVMTADGVPNAENRRVEITFGPGSGL